MIRVGTRGSALALAQTRSVVVSLGVEAEIVTIRTTGDSVTDRPVSQIGPRGVFAVELQRALLDGRIDLAVHSLKDLPAVEPDGLAIVAVPERADATDVVVGRPLAALPAGSTVGTSAERRRALIGELHPSLVVADMRGNVDTRLDKVARGDFDAAVLAAAGLERLGRAGAVVERLDPSVFVPAPGQGALAVEARAGEHGWVARIEHAPTRAAVSTERTFERLVEAGCSLPVGAWARTAGGRIECVAYVAGAGRARAEGTDPEEIARELADKLVA